MRRYIVRFKDDWNNTRTYGIYIDEAEAIETAWQLIERDIHVDILEGREVIGTMQNENWSAVWYSNLDLQSALMEN